MASAPINLTQMLNDAIDGDHEASVRAWSMVYPEIRNLARSQLLGERPGGGLQTTMVVNEIYLRMGGSGNDHWDNRAHFFGSVARSIGQFLIQQARHQNRLKRGGEWDRVPLELADGELESFDTATSGSTCRLIELLADLETIAPRPAEVAWLRYISGLSVDETATVLEIAPRTVTKDWSFARAWLRRELERREATG